METPKPQTIAAWTTLLTAQRDLLSRVERALKTAGLPPLSWYDALLEIERAGDAGVRPFALKDRLLLPQSGMSRLLDRLARDGLIEREICAKDGRGQLVRLTSAGSALRLRMWAVYSGFLIDAVENRLGPERASELASSLDQLIQR